MKPTILYIEKDEDERAQLRRVLKDAGYDLIVASSGREALEKAEKRGAQLTLLSFDLPDMDAFDLARQLRRPQGGLNYQPIIAVLVDALRGDAEKAFEAGCDEYITKPINVVELCDRIATLLASHPAEGRGQQ